MPLCNGPSVNKLLSCLVHVSLYSCLHLDWIALLTASHRQVNDCIGNQSFGQNCLLAFIFVTNRREWKWTED